jgi:hypothetical protein
MIVYKASDERVMPTFFTAVRIILVEWELLQYSVIHVILKNLK